MIDGGIQGSLVEQDMRNWMEIAKKVCINESEIEKSIRKERLMNEERLNFVAKKIQIQEYRKELQKASYEEVYFGTQGEVEVYAKNAIVDVPRRKLANFQFRRIFRLTSSEGDDGFYLVELFANMKNVQIFFDGEKVGKPDYLMKKIAEVGGEIYANKRRERENILIALWAKMYSLCEKTIIIPSHIGWIRDTKEDYKFIGKGDLLWEDIVKKAK